MTTGDKGKLFIHFVPSFTLFLLSKIVCSLCSAVVLFGAVVLKKAWEGKRTSRHTTPEAWLPLRRGSRRKRETESGYRCVYSKQLKLNFYSSYEKGTPAFDHYNTGNSYVGTCS